MAEDKFPHPLDTDIIEQVPVRKFHMDPKTEKIRQVIEMETRITRYVDVPKEKHRCKDGEHLFRVVDGGRGLFSCTLCPFTRKVYPTTHRFTGNLDTPGKLIHKVTHQTI